MKFSQILQALLVSFVAADSYDAGHFNRRFPTPGQPTPGRRASHITSAPSNVSPGTPTDPSKCNLYDNVISGDTCNSVALRNTISENLFASLNPEIDDGCFNIFAGQAYCIGAPGVPICTEVYTVPDKGGNCTYIESQYKITLAQFRALNSAVSADCNILPGYVYCVSTNPADRHKQTSTSNSTTPHRPTSTARCTARYTVVFMDTCNKIAAEYGITAEELEYLNPHINTLCTNLQPGDDLCVANSTGSCKISYEVLSGDTCDAIAAAYEVTVAQIHALNPQVNSGCTNLHPGETLCLQGSSSSATSPSTATSSNHTKHKTETETKSG